MTQGHLLRRIQPAVIAGFLAAGALVAPALAQTQAPLGRLFHAGKKAVARSPARSQCSGTAGKHRKIRR